MGIRAYTTTAPSEDFDDDVIEVGKLVRQIGGCQPLRILAVTWVPQLTLKSQDNVVFQGLAHEYEPLPQLSEQEVWLEVTTKINLYIHLQGVCYTASEPGGRKLRNECYIFIGGNHVRVTDEVKERLRGLIERTLNVYRWL